MLTWLDRGARCQNDVSCTYELRQDMMHDVCNIRDFELRTGQTSQEIWASYRADLDRCVERVFGPDRHTQTVRLREGAEAA